MRRPAAATETSATEVLDETRRPVPPVPPPGHRGIHRHAQEESTDEQERHHTRVPAERGELPAAEQEHGHGDRPGDEEDSHAPLTTGIERPSESHSFPLVRRSDDTEAG